MGKWLHFILKPKGYILFGNGYIIFRIGYILFRIGYIIFRIGYIFFRKSLFSKWLHFGTTPWRSLSLGILEIKYVFARKKLSRQFNNLQEIIQVEITILSNVTYG